MLTRRTALGLLTATPVALALGRPALAMTPEIYAEDGIAIDGSDAVAYFTEGKPVAGTPDFALDWRGAQWHFSSAENLAAFEADPEAYAPQFGGWCAWAVAQGYIAATHPNAWTIYEGKLYLNANRSVRRTWERDIPGNIARGLANWPAVLG